MNITRATVSYFCLCGDSMSGSFVPTMLPKVEEAWKEIHSGEGHGKTDRATCAKNRRKKERAENNRSFQRQTSFADGGFVRETHAAGALSFKNEGQQ